MPRRPAATSHSPPFLPTANATIKIIFADDHCLSRCRPSACLCRRCPRPCHRIVQLSAPTRPNNTVKLPQSQVPHSLTHPSSFIVCLLHSHRQKNTRSTPPRPADHQSVPSRVQPRPPQATTTADHRSPPPPNSCCQVSLIACVFVCTTWVNCCPWDRVVGVLVGSIVW